MFIPPESKSIDLSPEMREQNIAKLQRESFDILVVGGGITGAGIARDAALRGYKTALIEKADFCSGTSSKSSKLVHGGFRYLDNLEFGLVHESLMERKTLMEIAPHLVHPIQCLLPLHQHNAKPPWMIHIGLFLYDFLSFTKRIGYHQMLSKNEIQRLEPLLRHDDLKKIALYYDCQADDFRLVMANLQSAAHDGAVVANYVKAVDILKENGQIVGIKAMNEISSESFPIQSHVLANATGPWCDYLRQALLKDSHHHVRTTKGIHLVIHRKDLPINHTILGQAVQDGRYIFAVPWRQFVFLGTTDTDYDGDPDHIATERNDVDYLVEAFNHYFPDANLNDDKIISTFAGLRPLAFEEGKTASSVTREYEIFEQPKNFFNIIGGKLTTYRTMAKEMVNRMAKKLDKSFDIFPINPKCLTDKMPLYGGDIQDYKAFFNEWKTKLVSQFFDEDIAIHLIESYGSQVSDVLEYVKKTPHGEERFLPEIPYIWGELDYALQHEMTLSLDDFMIRRTHLFSLDRKQALDIHEEVASQLSKKLGWTEEEKKVQIERYKSKIEITQQYLQLP